MPDDLREFDLESEEFEGINPEKLEFLLLSDIFREADHSFLESEKTDLDDLAYKFILRFFKNTQPLSPYGLNIVTKLAKKPRYSGDGTKILIPELSDIFPPSSNDIVKEVAALRKKEQEFYYSKSDNGGKLSNAKTARNRRRREIQKIQEQLGALDATKNNIPIEEYKERLEELALKIMQDDVEIAEFEANKREIAAEQKDIKSQLEKAQARAREREYSLDKIGFLLRDDKKGDLFREQLLLDWKFVIEWLETQASSGQPKRQSPLHHNLNILCEKLDINQEDRNILEHMILLANVAFYKDFNNVLTVWNSEQVIVTAKLCEVHPDKIGYLNASVSDLLDKGLLENPSKLNARIVGILTAPGMTEELILRMLAGKSARDIEAPGFKWKDVEMAQGAGAGEMFVQLEERRKKEAIKPPVILLYGEKGAAKTQGAIKASLEAGYENATMAPEFDDTGKPLTYQQRLAAIKMGLAIGEKVPGFLLIVDEIDKMGGDQGANDSLALLRLFENSKTAVVATANNDKFSEAFKDRFGYSVRFHVPIADKRIDTFFAMAAGKLDDLKDNRQSYEDLLRRTEVLPRAMEQAIDNAYSTGRGIDAIRLSFMAKAELMTGSRTGLLTETPIIESWRFNYFNGHLREPKDTSVADLLTHIGNLKPQHRGITLIANATRQNIEIHALPAEIAKKFGLNILWSSSTLRDASVETLLNKAQDMNLMLVIENANDLVKFDGEEVLGLLERHKLPIVFLTSTRNLNSSSPIVNRAHFIVDCYPPSVKQAAEMCRQFLEVDLPESVLERMPGITLDIFQMAKYKRFQVLQDPNNLSQIEALLEQEYKRAMHDADQLPVFASWLSDTAVPKAAEKISLGQKAEKAGPADFWGPTIRF